MKLCIIFFNVHKISLNHPGLILLLKGDISMQDMHWLQLTHCNCVFIPNLSPFGIEPHSFLTTITIKQNYCYMYSSPHIHVYTCTSYISQTGIVHKLFFRLFLGPHDVLLVSLFSQHSTWLVHAYVDSLNPWTILLTVEKKSHFV